jgi:three-Cys-motif partner protein
MTDADASVGRWALEKLGALERYLTFFNRVLKNQRWCRERIFVDAFAGPGRSPVRPERKGPDAPLIDLISEASAEAVRYEELVEFVEGSPRIALSIPDPFSKYFFIERNDDRVARLREIQAEYGETRSIEIIQEDANSALRRLIAADTFRQKDTRAVVFLDPFGMQVPWSTVIELANTRAVEVIINFPMGMAIQRLLTRSGDLRPGWEEALDAYFGSPEWQQQVYEDKTGLFGAQKMKRRDAGTRLLEWYRQRLKHIFGNVSTPRLITNTRGGHLYYLIWAGHHPKGREGADHILKMGESIATHRKAKRK